MLTHHVLVNCVDCMRVLYAGDVDESGRCTPCWKLKREADDTVERARRIDAEMKGGFSWRDYWLAKYPHWKNETIDYTFPRGPYEIWIGPSWTGV